MSNAFGKYRLLAELGQGGMADVFLAAIAGPVGSGFSKLTVIKRLRQNLVEDPEFVTMLVDEARISARLNHPNVVQTNEVGEVDGKYFIAMEYLDGQPLHRVQFRVGKESDPAALKPMLYIVVVDALAGLHHAHELADYDGTALQIVHRDATPQNIFVTYEGQVKVVDFGIAKAGGRTSETKQGIVKGKVRYMAPEQALGGAVDRRVDVFCMGIVLWEIATGTRMWKGREDLDIVRDLLSNKYPRSPKAVDPTVPDEIDRICQKALAFAVDDRYDTAQDFRNELEHYMAESGLLVDARRKLGPTVSSLFQDKRTEIKQVIDRQLRELTSMTSSSGETKSPLAVIDASSGSTSSRGMAISTSTDQPPASEEPTEAIVSNHGQASRTLTPPTSGSRLRAPLAVGIALVIVVVLVVAYRRSTATASTTGSDAGIEAPLGENGTIDVSFTADPPTSAITLDDRVLGSVFNGKLPRDHRSHHVTVTAEGFEPKREEITFDSAVERHFVLQRASGAAASASSAKTAPIAKGNVPAWHPPPHATPSAAPPPPPAPAPAPTPEPPTPAPNPAASQKGRQMDKSDPWGTK